MQIRVTAIFSILVGTSSAFTPSKNCHGVSSTRLNLDNNENDALLTSPNADDRRSFVSKVRIFKDNVPPLGYFQIEK